MAARTDTDRLNWLDARVKNQSVYRDLVLASDWEDGVWLSEVRRGEYRGALALDSSAAPLDSIREAIDAAMDAEVPADA
jgi:hypothetical protein